MLETYLQLFLNCLLVSTFIPTDGETTLRYMLYYGIYPKPLLLAVSLAGAMAGLTFNWLLGRLGYTWIASSPKFKEQEGRYTKCHDFANTYGLGLIIIAFFNQAEAVLTLIAGMLKMRLPLFLASVAVGKGVYFAFFIYWG